jgi:hypothetical protein
MAVASSSAQAASLHKKISVVYTDAALSAVFEDIEKKCGVRIAYSKEEIRGIGPLDYEARDKEAGRILCRILLPRGLKLKAPLGDSVTVVRQDAYALDVQVSRRGKVHFQKPGNAEASDQPPSGWQGPDRVS